MGLLPTVRSKPKTHLGEFVTLLYGPPKVGKTTFASQFPDAVFLATEAGQNALSVMRTDIDSWDKFTDVCLELHKGNHGFKTVVIDTIDNLWQLCRRHFIEKHGVEHETDGKLGYGKGSAIILTEFQRVMTKLSLLDMGLLMISHADRETVEIKTATVDESYHRWVPAIASKARIPMMGMADFLLFANFVGPRAVPTIHTKATKHWMAGDRTKYLPETLPFEYEDFHQAFKASIQKNQAAVSKATMKNNGPTSKVPNPTTKAPKTPETKPSKPATVSHPEASKESTPKATPAQR